MVERKLRMLFASKDMGGAEMGVPLAEAARANGHLVLPVLEGLAAARYEAKGFAPKPEHKGSVNFIDEPFDFDAKLLLEEINPDVVIVTMGSPINIEDLIGAAANACMKPLAAVSDTWGSLTRAKKSTANLMLTLDDVDSDIARKNFSHPFETVVVGDHAIRKLRTLKISDEIRQKMDALKRERGKVILFAGGGADYTTPEIALLKECLKMTLGSWVVIKRYHPKHAERISPDGRPWGKVWDEMFAEVGDCAIELPTKEGDAVAALADATVSGFSTMGRTALGSYKSAVALVTPETRASHKAQTTIERWPPAVMGLAPEVSEPCDLTPIIERRPSPDEVNRRLKPYDPAVALAAIEKLCTA